MEPAELPGFDPAALPDDANEDLLGEELAREPSIRGTVRDFADQPVVGVRVEAAASAGGGIDQLPVITDGAGDFHLQGLEKGTYDLRFAAGGVRARMLAVPTDGPPLAVHMARPQGLVLDVRIRPDDPKPGALHLVLDRVVGHGGEGTTRREYVGVHAQSRLTLYSLRPGRYRLWVWAPPYLPVEAEGLLVERDKPALDVPVLLAAQGSTLTGCVRDSSGQATPGWVCLRRLDLAVPAPRRFMSVETDPEGRFAWAGLEAGRYQVAVWDAEERLAASEIELGDEAHATLELTVEPSGEPSGEH